jgi:ParB family transcriptional regulator, chromosome partitioning protein
MALGKGLSALISKDSLNQFSDAYIPALPIDQVSPNPYQPRIEIKPEGLMDLADSIRENGIIEPLIVSKNSKGEFELIAGERRLRAAKMAKLPTVPVVVREASPQQMLVLAVIENVQRKDLNPIEEALAFEQLINMFNMTHADIATKISYSRPAVANKLRLLSLPQAIKRYLLEGKISEGHARALLGITSKEAMLAAAQITVRDKLSVRAVEELVRRLNHGQKKLTKKSMRIIDEYTQSIEITLRQQFGTKVSLYRSAKGGKIVIPFNNDKQLEDIYKSISK